MSQIHVRTILEALPGDIYTLKDRTGYNTGLVFKYIMEARQAGHQIAVRWQPDSMSEYTHERECACGDDKND